MEDIDVVRKELLRLSQLAGEVKVRVGTWEMCVVEKNVLPFKKQCVGVVSSETHEITLVYKDTVIGEFYCEVEVIYRWICKNSLDGKELQVTVKGKPLEGIQLDIQIRSAGEEVERYSVCLHE